MTQPVYRATPLPYNQALNNGNWANWPLLGAIRLILPCVSASGYINFGKIFGRYPTFHTLTSVGRKKLSVFKKCCRFFVSFISIYVHARKKLVRERQFTLEIALTYPELHVRSKISLSEIQSFFFLGKAEL